LLWLSIIYKQFHKSASFEFLRNPSIFAKKYVVSAGGQIIKHNITAPHHAINICHICIFFSPTMISGASDAAGKSFPLPVSIDTQHSENSIKNSHNF
jgi:hypothetical protein